MTRTRVRGGTRPDRQTRRHYSRTQGGVAVVIGWYSGFKYSSFFADVLSGEGLPVVEHVPESLRDRRS